MQQTNGVAILATQLATTDRRALSQAWYSALHLAGRAHPAERGSAAGATARRPDAPAVRASGAAHERRGAGAPAARPAPARGARPEIVAAGTVERRAPASELARRIERAIVRRVPAPAPVSFAISAADGRVHVLVRSDGAATRIVAVCAPPLRAAVERALAQARYALAGRGIRTEAA